MKKQPEQTARTRQNIIDAFWELAAEQGLNKVTISAITKKSNLNRGTFYVYFTDMDDLLKQTEDEMICDWEKQMEASLSKRSFEDFAVVSQKMIDIFTRYDEKLFLLLGKNGDPRFIAQIRERVAVVFRKAFNISSDIPYQDYVIVYATSAFTGLLTYWHDTGRKISINELAAIAHAIITRGIFGYIEKNNGSRYIPHARIVSPA